MNNDINPFLLRYLRLKLTLWGAWSRRILLAGLGYSNKSIFYQVMQESGMEMNDKRKSSILTNEEIETIDSLVEQLGSEKPEWAKVLSIHYIEETLVQDKIKRSGFSRRTYFHYLRSAELWVLSIVN